MIEEIDKAHHPHDKGYKYLLSYKMLQKLLNNLEKMNQRHRNIFFNWIENIMLPLFPQPHQERLSKQLKYVKPEEVDTVISNLGRSIEDYFKTAKLEGIREGEKRGKLEALAEVVQNMLSNGISEEEIARMTRIPLEQIREFKIKER